MIGLECPRPGTSARHSKPSSFPAAAATFQLARVGKPSAMPCPPGPRNCGQFCSDLNASEAAGNASKEAVRNERRDNGITIHPYRGFPFLSRREPPEEAVSPPLRAFVAIGDDLRYAQVNAIEIRRRLKINRLLQIVRRRVIAFGAPAFDYLVLRRAFDKSDLQRSRRNAALDEAVLIAAREGIALRFRVGEDLQLQLTARGLQIIREVRFLQPLYNQTAQRKQR